jgi:hypothetical protein
MVFSIKFFIIASLVSVAASRRVNAMKDEIGAEASAMVADMLLTTNPLCAFTGIPCRLGGVASAAVPAVVPKMIATSKVKRRLYSGKYKKLPREEGDKHTKIQLQKDREIRAQNKKEYEEKTNSFFTEVVAKRVETAKQEIETLTAAHEAAAKEVEQKSAEETREFIKASDGVAFVTETPECHHREDTSHTFRDLVFLQELHDNTEIDWEIKRVDISPYVTALKEIMPEWAVTKHGVVAPILFVSGKYEEPLFEDVQACQPPDFVPPNLWRHPHYHKVVEEVEKDTDKIMDLRTPEEIFPEKRKDYSEIEKYLK